MNVSPTQRKMGKTGIIILAAGNSIRLGKPKQLLLYKGITLIEHIVSEAKQANLYPVIVITGFYRAEIAAVLDKYEVYTLFNENWREGMASGIVKGISKLSSFRQIEDVIISVCDQPCISSYLFRKLIEAKEKSGKEIIASAYSDTLGTPVLFGRNYFPALRLLTGHQGAKKILELDDSDVGSVTFEEGRFDIDTIEDYNNLVSRT